MDVVCGGRSAGTTFAHSAGLSNLSKHKSDFFMAETSPQASESDMDLMMCGYDTYIHTSTRTLRLLHSWGRSVTRMHSHWDSYDHQSHENSIVNMPLDAMIRSTVKSTLYLQIPVSSSLLC